MKATRSLVGVLVVAFGFATIAVAVTGVGNDWLGGWLIRCGRRWARHACEAGEVPWRLVFWGALTVVVGLAIACAEIAVRTRRASLGLRFERRAAPGPAGIDRSASVGPPSGSPPAGPAAPQPARPSDVEALARRIGL